MNITVILRKFFCISISILIFIIADLAKSYAGQSAVNNKNKSNLFSNNLKTYPLNFNLSSVKWLEFKNLGKNNIFILANTPMGFEVSEFLLGRTHLTARLEGPLNVLDNPIWISMGKGDLSNPVDGSIVSNGVKITSITSVDDVNFHNDYFDNSCPDPAPNSVRIEKNGDETEKVLFYVFDHSVELIPSTPCEKILFSSPHKRIRIINPQIIATKNDTGDVLIAGKSYTSMPIVISIPDIFHFNGNGSNIFFLNKGVVDKIRQETADEYRDKGRAHTSSSELAALIETRLLNYLKDRGK